MAAIVDKADRDMSIIAESSIGQRCSIYIQDLWPCFSKCGTQRSKTSNICITWELVGPTWCTFYQDTQVTHMYIKMWEALFWNTNFFFNFFLKKWILAFFFFPNEEAIELVNRKDFKIKIKLQGRKDDFKKKKKEKELGLFMQLGNTQATMLCAWMRWGTEARRDTAPQDIICQPVWHYGDGDGNVSANLD